MFEVVARQTKHQLRGEFLLGQIAFAAEALHAALVEDQRRRCPERVEAVEERAGILDVRGDWNEVLIDERGELGVGVRFGLQPNATASSGSSAEIEEYRFVLGLCARLCAVKVFDPFHCHECLPRRI